MSRVKCKKEENPLQKLINSMRFDFAVQREKDKMLNRINDRLRREYGDHKRIL